MTRLSEDQKRAAHSDALRTAVTAAAGSGKTRILIERFLYWVFEKKIRPDQIIAITYTQKAAAELQSRLMEAFRKSGYPDGVDWVGGGTVNTIHGFCLKLLRENPIEAGLDPAVRVWDEKDARREGRRIWRSLLDRRLSQNPSALEDLWRVTGGGVLEEAAWKVYSEIRQRQRSASQLTVCVVEPQTAAELTAAEALKLFRGLLIEFEADYEKAKLEKSAIDFEDQMIRAGRLLEHPMVTHWIRRRYRAILIDEFQDMNEAQYGWYQKISVGMASFSVGDIRQSIYGFRGANCALLQKECAEVRSLKKGLTQDLPGNYRSKPFLIDWTNRVFGALTAAAGIPFGRLEPRLEREDGVSLGEIWLAAPSGEGVSEDRTREAERIARRIRVLVQDPEFWIQDKSGGLRRADFGDFAVLMRRSTALSIYEEAFRNAGISYHVVKGRRFFDREEVSDLLNVIRLCLKPEDRLILFGVLKSPLAALQDAALFRFAESLEENDNAWEALKRLAGNAPEEGAAGEVWDEEEITKLRYFVGWMSELMASAWTQSPHRVLRRILERTRFDAAVLSFKDGPRRFANIRKLEGFAMAYEEGGGDSVDDFVEWVEAFIADGDADEEPEAVLSGENESSVRILTIHAAKGLEFPVVILPETGPQRSGGRSQVIGVLQTGELACSVPNPAKEGRMETRAMKTLKEERLERENEEALRLLYVAMTRPTHYLMVSGTQTRPAKEDRHSWLDRVLNGLNEADRDAAYDRCGAPGEAACGAPAPLSACGVKIFAVPAAGVPRENLKEAAGAPESIQGRPDPFDPEGLKVYFCGERPADLGVIRRKAGVTEIAKAWGVGSSAPLRAKDEGASPGDPSHSAAFFGTLCHEVLREVDLGADPDFELKRLHRWMASRVDLSALERLDEILARYLRGPEFESIRHAARSGAGVFKELPLTVRMERNDPFSGKHWGFVKGQADLVFRSGDGAWTVVDYKSGFENRSSYETQLKIYAWMIRVLFEAKSVKAWLYFVDTGEWREVNTAEACRDDFGQRLGERFWADEGREDPEEGAFVDTPWDECYIDQPFPFEFSEE